MSNGKNFKTPTRFWYEYRGERLLVPAEFVYKIHDSMGGGYDISEAFFTWAFNKHSISIIDIQVPYSNEDRTPKSKNKDELAASSTFFIATVRGKDKFGLEKVGDGEVGNESINNFQRKFPAGLAIKRAKVNMGKEFFNLTDLSMATDCRDFEVKFGEYKDQTLGDMIKTKEGLNTVRWYASEKYNGEPILKLKAQDVLSRFVDIQLMTNEQKDIINKYRAKGVTDKDITTIAKNNFQDFAWNIATKEQVDKIINELSKNHGTV